MKVKNKITKMKTNIAFKIATVSTTITSLMIAAIVQFNAADVDFSGGVKNVTDKVISQGKTIAATIFGAIAVIALAFTIFKGIKAGISHHKNEPMNITPVIGGCVATIVAGLASTTAIFGWFGL